MWPAALPTGPGHSTREVVIDRQRRVVAEPLGFEHLGTSRRLGQGGGGQVVQDATKTHNQLRPALEIRFRLVAVAPNWSYEPEERAGSASVCEGHMSTLLSPIYTG